MSDLRIGGNESPVGMVIFSDYECPACLVLHQQLQRYEQEGKLPFAVLYRHWPIARHRFAESAAVAAECAARQGQFASMHNVLFDHQAKLGLVPWAELAASAGVPNLGEFERCLEDRERLSKVREDAAVAQANAFRGTPTVILAGGTRFAGVPAKQRLDSLLSAVANSFGQGNP